MPLAPPLAGARPSRREGEIESRVCVNSLCVTVHVCELAASRTNPDEITNPTGPVNAYLIFTGFCPGPVIKSLVAVELASVELASVELASVEPMILDYHAVVQTNLILQLVRCFHRAKLEGAPRTPDKVLTIHFSLPMRRRRCEGFRRWLGVWRLSP